MTRVLAAVGALGAAWAFWRWGGAATAALGLGAFDPLARLVLVVLALTLAEAGLARLAPPSGGSHDPPADASTDAPADTPPDTARQPRSGA